MISEIQNYQEASDLNAVRLQNVWTASLKNKEHFCKLLFCKLI